MTKLAILQELTKKYILDRVTQEEIMEYYIRVPVNETTLSASSFLSVFRGEKIDNNPTCNYYYTEDKDGNLKLRVRDWDGSFKGDVFDVASFMTGINTKTSQGFKLLLHKIASDFKIHQYADSSLRKKLEIVVEEHVKRVNLKIFKIIPRAWNVYDKRYWYDRFGVGTEGLKVGRVYPVQVIEVEGKDGYLHPIYKYFAKDPAYAYYGGVINGIKIWKIYFPLRDRSHKFKRFLTNYAFIFKLTDELPSRIGIITKSAKDVIVYRYYGITARAVSSETHLMTPDEFWDFKSRHDIIFTNFDYDATGIRLANKYKKEYNCYPLMFTRGRFNQPDYGVKDFSEFRETYGHERTQLLVNTLFEQYSDVLDSINQYNYNSLKWI